MMENKFTPRAEESLRLAQEAAEEMGHGYVGSEHLLLGLMREEEGIAHRVLEEAGLTDDMICDVLHRSVGTGLSGAAPSQGLTPRAKSAVEWFQDVLDNAPEGYANLNMARVYVNIGSFYRDITTDITEASDKGKYKPFFDNIRELLDTVATDENESEIVRLELLELSRSALQQYATKFKGDGISQADMMQMYDQVERTVTGISATADTTEHKKEATVSLLADTKKAIETAYATKGGKQA